MLKHEIPLVIVCIKCVQRMTIHSQHNEFNCDTLVAASCKCGKILGLVSDMKRRYARNEAISSEMIEPMTPDQVGECGKEMRENAQRRMINAEKFIAAATWAREPGE